MASPPLVNWRRGFRIFYYRLSFSALLFFLLFSTSLLIQFCFSFCLFFLPFSYAATPTSGCCILLPLTLHLSTFVFSPSFFFLVISAFFFCSVALYSICLGSLALNFGLCLNPLGYALTFSHGSPILCGLCASPIPSVTRFSVTMFINFNTLFDILLTKLDSFLLTL